MKFKFLNKFVIILILFSSCKKNTINIKTNGIIPIPSEIISSNGSFQLNGEVSVNIKSEELSELATLFSSQLNIGQVNSIDENKTNSITLSIDENLKKEGYQLNISIDNIQVKGGDKAGVFYALQTINQLKIADRVPAVTINDAPQFKYRGMMLDVARYFYPVEDVKKFIDLMAMHKYNKFHWHLTDDQGWRIEIKKYPKLTQIGSKRKYSMKGNFRDSYARKALWEVQGKWDFRKKYTEHPNDFDSKPHEGFYTQEQIKDIVKYAGERFIEVIPEIDVPGHSSAALASYPEYGYKDAYTVSGRWSVHPNVFSPTEGTFKFLEDVFTEVIALFPTNNIHVGGDEANKTHWEDSEFCQSLIKKYNLKDEMGLQSYFIGRLDRFLTSKGKNLIGWDEILEGGLSENATVMSWRGEKGGIEAAKHHHNVIMAPGNDTYFDKYQDSTEFANKMPLAQWGLVTLKRVYSYNPLPKELSSEQHKYILGAEGCMWTEYISNTEYLEYMALPRMTALSEVLWSNPENKNWEDFNNRLQDIFKLYDQKGYNYATHFLKK